MGVNIRSTVKKAARFAVYVEMMIRVKNHQTLPARRPDTDLLKEITSGNVSFGNSDSISTLENPSRTGFPISGYINYMRLCGYINMIRCGYVVT